MTVFKETRTILTILKDILTILLVSMIFTMVRVLTIFKEAMTVCKETMTILTILKDILPILLVSMIFTMVKSSLWFCSSAFAAAVTQLQQFVN